MKATTEVLPDGHQQPIPIVVGVDTLSDVTLASRDILSSIHAISPDQVRGSGGNTSFLEEGSLDMYHMLMAK